MKLILSKVLPALIYSSALIYALTAFLPHYREANAPHEMPALRQSWELHNGPSGMEGRVFLLNKETGMVFRYYRNTDGKGGTTDEGFALLAIPTP